MRERDAGRPVSAATRVPPVTTAVRGPLALQRQAGNRALARAVQRQVMPVAPLPVGPPAGLLAQLALRSAPMAEGAVQVGAQILGTGAAYGGSATATATGTALTGTATATIATGTALTGTTATVATGTVLATDAIVTVGGAVVAEGAVVTTTAGTTLLTGGAAVTAEGVVTAGNLARLGLLSARFGTVGLVVAAVLFVAAGTLLVLSYQHEREPMRDPLPDGQEPMIEPHTGDPISAPPASSPGDTMIEPTSDAKVIDPLAEQRAPMLAGTSHRPSAPPGAHSGPPYQTEAVEESSTDPLVSEPPVVDLTADVADESVPDGDFTVDIGRGDGPNTVRVVATERASRQRATVRVEIEDGVVKIDPGGGNLLDWPVRAGTDWTPIGVRVYEMVLLVLHEHVESRLLRIRIPELTRRELVSAQRQGSTWLNPDQAILHTGLFRQLAAALGALGMEAEDPFVTTEGGPADRFLVAGVRPARTPGPATSQGQPTSPGQATPSGQATPTAQVTPDRASVPPGQPANQQTTDALPDICADLPAALPVSGAPVALSRAGDNRIRARAGTTAATIALDAQGFHLTIETPVSAYGPVPGAEPVTYADVLVAALVTAVQPHLLGRPVTASGTTPATRRPGRPASQPVQESPLYLSLAGALETAGLSLSRLAPLVTGAGRQPTGLTGTVTPARPRIEHFADFVTPATLRPVGDYGLRLVRRGGDSIGVVADDPDGGSCTATITYRNGEFSVGLETGGLYPYTIVGGVMIAELMFARALDAIREFLGSAVLNAAWTRVPRNDQATMTQHRLRTDDPAQRPDAVATTAVYQSLLGALARLGINPVRIEQVDVVTPAGKSRPEVAVELPGELPARPDASAPDLFAVSTADTDAANDTYPVDVTSLPAIVQTPAYAIELSKPAADLIRLELDSKLNSFHHTIEARIDERRDVTLDRAGAYYLGMPKYRLNGRTGEQLGTFLLRTLMTAVTAQWPDARSVSMGPIRHITNRRQADSAARHLPVDLAAEHTQHVVNLRKILADLGIPVQRVRAAVSRTRPPRDGSTPLFLDVRADLRPALAGDWATSDLRHERSEGIAPAPRVQSLPPLVVTRGDKPLAPVAAEPGQRWQIGEVVRIDENAVLVGATREQPPSEVTVTAERRPGTIEISGLEGPAAGADPDGGPAAAIGERLIALLLHALGATTETDLITARSDNLAAQAERERQSGRTVHDAIRETDVFQLLESGLTTAGLDIIRFDPMRDARGKLVGVRAVAGPPAGAAPVAAGESAPAPVAAEPGAAPALASEPGAAPALASAPAVASEPLPEPVLAPAVEPEPAPEPVWDDELTPDGPVSMPDDEPAVDGPMSVPDAIPATRPPSRPTVRGPASGARPQPAAPSGGRATGFNKPGAALAEYTVTSLIRRDPLLTRLAQDAGAQDRVQQEMNGLQRQLALGNFNAGIGMRALPNGVFYMRGVNGARLFFRRAAGGAIEILGKASKNVKNNEDRVIARLTQLYGN